MLAKIPGKQKKKKKKIQVKLLTWESRTTEYSFLTRHENSKEIVI